jgi:hypothetical protein
MTPEQALAGYRAALQRELDSGNVKPREQVAAFVAFGRTVIPSLIAAVEEALRHHMHCTQGINLQDYSRCLCGQPWPCPKREAIERALEGK